jgi:hypothetical protein
MCLLMLLLFGILHVRDMCATQRVSVASLLGKSEQRRRGSFQFAQHGRGLLEGILHDKNGESSRRWHGFEDNPVVLCA